MKSTNIVFNKITVERKEKMFYIQMYVMNEALVLGLENVDPEFSTQ